MADQFFTGKRNRLRLDIYQCNKPMQVDKLKIDSGDRLSLRMEFFRHCPGCGRRFHIKLVEKSLLDDYGSKTGDQSLAAWCMEWHMWERGTYVL